MRYGSISWMHSHTVAARPSSTGSPQPEMPASVLISIKAQRGTHQPCLKFCDLHSNAPLRQKNTVRFQPCFLRQGSLQCQRLLQITESAGCRRGCGSGSRWSQYSHRDTLRPPSHSGLRRDRACRWRKQSRRCRTRAYRGNTSSRAPWLSFSFWMTKLGGSMPLHSCRPRF